MLEVDDVTVRFGGHRALGAVSMRAQAGEITGLIGPNGAGKTTLFNVIAGLMVPDTGRVWFGGRDITRVAPHRRARLGMARTFQQLQLYGTLTVAENVELAARGAADESPTEIARRLMGMLGIAHLADALAHTVPTGQARLVELARAMATTPDLLLLDEPASGQDPGETEHFKEVLVRIAGDGVGILLVEHDVPLVMDVCSSINVLDFGTMIASGAPDEVRSDPAVVAAYLGTPQGIA